MRASKCRVSLIALACALMLVGAVPASADTVSWVHWTSGTTSVTAGSATGTISGLGINVSYTGEQRGISTGVFWTPTSSFSGGSISNAPVEPTNQAIILDGGGTVTDTITFSSAVTDPVIAIWSLGAPRVPANFTFTAGEPFTVEGGGPSSQFAGTSIFAGGTCPANAVCGNEGNGVIQFHGTFTSISWTNPSFESFYAFTVGAFGVPTTGGEVPEPASLLLLGSGLVGGALTRLKRFKK